MKFTSLLKRVIVESADRIDFLIDTYTKPKKTDKGTKKPKLSVKELAALVAADPMSKLNDVDIETANPKELEKVHAGKYTQWLIKSYLSPSTERQPGDRGYEEEVKRLAFDFYYDMSHKMGVNTNQISENATNVDIWFEQLKKKEYG